MADYYELLGVSRSATAGEIKQAYRRLARQSHPDANQGDAAAADRFKEIARAYQVLSDPQARERYDRFGEAGVTSAGGSNVNDMFGGAGLGDLFDAFFGGGGRNPFGGAREPSGPPRGQDMETTLTLTFEQAVFGARVDVGLKLPQRCDDCGGSGAGAGTRPVTCSECGGSGQVQRVRQSILGQMVTASPCRRCGGAGVVIATPCPTCRGEGRITVDRTYPVDVPAGVDTGSTLRLTGRGAAGPRGGGPGDLYVHLRVSAHERYRRDGEDLVTELKVSYVQAALGTTVMLPTLDGEVEIVVEPGTQPGTVVVRRDLGVPRLQGRGRGSLRVNLVVEVPTSLDEREHELLRAIAEHRGDDVHPPGKRLFSRLKSAFQ